MLCLPQTLLADDYTLVWADEFNDRENLAANWNCETASGSYKDSDGNDQLNPNQELQYYLPANVSIADGKLVIKAKKETYSDGTYTKYFTSGRLNSQGKVKFKYGKLVAKIKMPLVEDGLWPAFWMLGADFRGDPWSDIYTNYYHGEAAWPNCGEIDIVEVGNGGNAWYSGAVHYGPGYEIQTESAQGANHSEALGNDYHLFTMEWDEQSIRLYFDQSHTPYATFDSSNTTYFDKFYHIMLDLAVGGGFTGKTTVDAVTALNDGERYMYVDYIRLYQKQTGGGYISHWMRMQTTMPTA